MEKNTLGVVIGRFQVSSLHKGHRYLLDYASSRHEHFLVLLGVTPALANSRNPLDFPTRKALVEKLYPSARVVEVRDQPSDEKWSEHVDSILKREFPNIPATLYGSRDSFLPYYNGAHPTEDVQCKGTCNGTKVRSRVGARVLRSASFRAGAIYASKQRLPISYQTVDIAIVDRHREKVLLGHKNVDGEKYRFIGGFVDPTDRSLEEAAKREIKEEVGMIEIVGMQYLGSYRVEDYRYRHSEDKILTSFFVTDFIFGAAKPADDIDAVKWVPIRELESVLVKEHLCLGERLIAHLNTLIK